MECSRRDLLGDTAELRSWKITKIRTTPLFFKIDLYSAISMECSRWDLLNDMAEHRSILKNNRNTYHPYFGFTPKLGIAFPITWFCFYCALFRWYCILFKKTSVGLIGISVIEVVEGRNVASSPPGVARTLVTRTPTSATLCDQHKRRPLAVSRLAAWIPTRPATINHWTRKEK